MSRTVASLLIVFPVAVVTGGFAGWAAGSAAGEWLETLGFTEMIGLGGRIGGLLGASLCSVYVAYKVFKDERAMTKTQTKRRET